MVCCTSDETTRQQIGDRDVWLIQRVVCGPCAEREDADIMLALSRSESSPSMMLGIVAIAVMAFSAGILLARMV